MKQLLIQYRKLYDGFSLIETAIVLAIIAILIGFGLPAWTQLHTIQRRQQCQKNIEIIKHALGQYVVTHKYLPCPVIHNKLEINSLGISPKNCFKLSQSSGTVPFQTLGIPQSQTFDSLNQPILYSVNSHFTNYNTIQNIRQIDENKIVMQIENGQSAITDDYNPIIYVLVAINEGNEKAKDLSLFEHKNLSNTLSFYDLPYSAHPDKKFRHNVSWMAANMFVAQYGQGILVRTQSTKDTRPPEKIPDKDLKDFEYEKLPNPSSAIINSDSIFETEYNGEVNGDGDPI